MLNKVSWALIITFVFAWFAMEYYSGSNIMEGMLMTLPLLIIEVFMFENELVLRDKSRALSVFSIVNFSFYYGALLSLIVGYNNTDLRGWWPLYLYVIFAIGLVYSLIYTLISYFSSFYNKRYHYFFASLIILTLAFQRFLPLYVTIYPSWETYSVSVLLFVFILAHAITNILSFVINKHKNK